MSQLPSNIATQKFRFVSTESFTKFLQCSLCHKLMIKPVRLNPCAHTFCYKCINQDVQPLDEKLRAENSNCVLNKRRSSKINKKVCPLQTCLKKYTAIQVDRTAEALVDELKVECINQGCVWKGNFDDYKKVHMNKCYLNGGLNEWLTNLKKNIIPRSSTNQKIEDASEEQKEQFEQPKQVEEILQEYKNEKMSQEKKINANQIVFDPNFIVPFGINNSENKRMEVQQSNQQQKHQQIHKNIKQPAKLIKLPEIQQNQKQNSTSQPSKLSRPENIKNDEYERVHIPKQLKHEKSNFGSVSVRIERTDSKCWIDKGDGYKELDSVARLSINGKQIKNIRLGEGFKVEVQKGEKGEIRIVRMSIV